MSRELVRSALKRDEGTGPVRAGRMFPYFDCCGKFFRDCRCEAYGRKQGKLTLAYGRNIEDIGVSLSEGGGLLENDIDRSAEDLLKAVDFAADLDPVRYAALLNLSFNLGIPKLLTFRKMLLALRNREWDRAADELLNSKYAAQVGQRAIRLSRMLRSGEWK